MSKCQAVIFGNGAKNLIERTLQSNGIMLLNEINYLCIQIDNRLSFEGFYVTIHSKLNQTMGAISVLRKKLLIQSHLMYGIFLLLRLSINELNQLQVQQNKVLKMIYGLPFRTATSNNGNYILYGLQFNN